MFWVKFLLLSDTRLTAANMALSTIAPSNLVASNDTSDVLELPSPVSIARDGLYFVENNDGQALELNMDEYMALQVQLIAEVLGTTTGHELTASCYSLFWRRGLRSQE